MKVRKYNYYVGDFETTVYEGQVRTDVWASAIVKMFSDDVKIMHSIGETWEYIRGLSGNIVIYYHNLKFDGSFWIDFFLNDLKMQQSYIKLGDFSYQWLSTKEMPPNTFKYSISDRGQWYTIIVKDKNRVIELRDSLKLLPFSVKEIGNSFQTKHKKLDMDYVGVRYPGCDISDKEKKYISNDVLVIKEALEIMFKGGHDKLTIGSCCLEEFKKTYDKEDYDMFFPNIYEIKLDKEKYGYETAGDYIRKSYKGGWCYLVKGKEGVIKKNGTTADVNSLYPSMMSSESGNYYPVGKPTFWKGNLIPEIAKNKYYFIRCRFKFKIKDGYLPFIQLKGTFLYKGNESLETSDFYYNGEYYEKMKMPDGSVKDSKVELVLTRTDYELIKEHYYLYDFEILDGCWFYQEIGIFDEYINKYKKIKQENSGAVRTLAKLFLNNLYGKESASTDSSFKVCYIKDNGALGFISVKENKKTPGYIPCGSAITSYSRCFTIRAAQKNYFGVNKRGFIYADTDSIHCDLAPHEIRGIKVHPSDFCCWKLESCWDIAIFTRQKTYIEHVVRENLLNVPHKWDVKCAGMSKKCKDLFIDSVIYNSAISNKPKKAKKILINKTETEKNFIREKRDITDFKVGLKIPGKLMAKRIPGGVLLVNTDYQMR